MKKMKVTIFIKDIPFIVIALEVITELIILLEFVAYIILLSCHFYSFFSQFV